jgi:hypothetical protein
MINYNKTLKILNADYVSIENKAHLLFTMSLKPNSSHIFYHIPRGKCNAITCSDISSQTGDLTKSISSQIRQMSKNYPIKKIKQGRIYKYYI